MVIDSLTGKTSWGSTRGLGFTPTYISRVGIGMTKLPGGTNTLGASPFG